MVNRSRDGGELPRNFRKESPAERRARLSELLEADEREWRLLAPTSELSDLAEVMVESALGAIPVPLGVASNMLIDGRIYQVPMAVEEPSVIAAATYAGGLISKHGGFSTDASEPVMTGQLLLEAARAGAEEAIEAGEEEIVRAMAPHLKRMSRRGGGYLGLGLRRLPKSDRLLVEINIDVRDAMGANIVNSAAEAARPVLERLSGGRALMAILTNSATRRVARARFSLPFHALRRGELSGEEMAHRIVSANEFALEDADRAVTHNKGIMNGVSSLALATANDTRAVEAAAHAFAVRGGAYRALTRYEIRAETLRGELELPLALGTVGGATSFHPVATLALRLLSLNLDHRITAGELSRVAVAVGLAQNLAALSALVGEGIQKGHMRLHAKRLAWKAGAGGEEIAPLSLAIWEGGVFNLEEAKRLLGAQRERS
ncbi:MAG: hydroxymethylglutaryl-CoA reductase, degradative [Spirochaetaceae bacterium]